MDLPMTRLLWLALAVLLVAGCSSWSGPAEVRLKDGTRIACPEGLWFTAGGGEMSWLRHKREVGIRRRVLDAMMRWLVLAVFLVACATAPAPPVRVATDQVMVP